MNVRAWNLDTANCKGPNKVVIQRVCIRYACTESWLNAQSAIQRIMCILIYFMIRLKIPLKIFGWYGMVWYVMLWLFKILILLLLPVQGSGKRRADPCSKLSFHVTIR